MATTAYRTRKPRKARAFSGYNPDESATIQAAMCILRRYARQTCALSSPQTVRDYLRLELATEPRECFAVVYLDAQNRVIESEILFTGTLTQTSVFPREVVKASLRRNAAAVIFAHNHPSGLAEPSRADEVLTSALKQTLALVDVKVLDHFIVTVAGSMSFAERGLL